MKIPIARAKSMIPNESHISHIGKLFGSTEYLNMTVTGAVKGISESVLAIAECGSSISELMKNTGTVSKIDAKCPHWVDSLYSAPSEAIASR